jgi:tetratricopeptide (TPR) repeat protein
MRSGWVLALVLAVLTGAHAAPDAGMAACARAKASSIGDCTKLIASGRLSKDDLALAYYNRAVADQAAGLNQHAIDDLAQAIRNHPVFLEALFNRGYLLIQEHRYASALDDLGRAVALNPKLPMPHVLLGVSNDNLNRHAAAQREFDAAVALGPSDPRTFSARGSSHLRFGEAAAALADFNAALKINPDLAFVLSARGTTLRYLGRVAEADRDFDRAVALNPNNAEFLSHRCWHRAVLHRAFPLAKKDCDAAVRRSPASPNPYDSRGFLYLMNGKYKEAIADYEIALAIDPRFTSSLYGRGVARRRLGDVAAGNSDMKAAAAVDSNVARRFARDGLTP